MPYIPIRKTGSATATATPPRTGPFVEDVHSLKPIPKLPPRYIPTTNYGASNRVDPSGRPLQTFHDEARKVDALQRDRIYPGFDPSVATTTDTKNFYNPRVVPGRAQVKKEMGGQYSDELDHRIALAVGGSNDRSNLNIIAGRIGGTAAELDKLIRPLQLRVARGEVSLEQARDELLGKKAEAAKPKSWHERLIENAVEEVPFLRIFNNKAGKAVMEFVPRKLEETVERTIAPLAKKGGVQQLLQQGVPGQVGSKNLSVAEMEKLTVLAQKGVKGPEARLKVAAERLWGPAIGAVHGGDFGLRSVAGKIPKELEALAQEARRYGSAEEFVKARGKPLFHGTALNFDSFDVSKTGSVKYADWGKGVYLTPSKYMADSYAGEATVRGNAELNALGDKLTSIEKTLKPKSQYDSTPAYTKEWEDTLTQYQQLRAKVEADKSGRVIKEVFLSPEAKVAKHYIEPGSITHTSLADELKQEGYDAVQIFGGTRKDGFQLEEVVVMNPDVLKTKSQLTDLYHQATAGASGATPRGAGATRTEPLAQRGAGAGPAETPPTPSKYPRPSAGGSGSPTALSPADAVPARTVRGTPSTGVRPLVDDARRLAKSQALNVNRLSLSEAGKRVLDETVDAVRPQMERVVGSPLTNTQVVQRANGTARVFQKTVGKDQTLAWEANMLNLRRKLVALSEQGTVTREFVDTYRSVRSQAADIGRKLQSLSIQAEPRLASAREVILNAVFETSAKADEIIQAAEGVDFDDARQAAEFYRRFVQPTAGEWLDLVRYNSMLSSPKTHIVNAFSNAVNATLTAPVEKALQGGIDFLSSKVTGSNRQAFSGEAGAYLKAYTGNLRTATKRFGSVMRGEAGFTNLDLRQVPVAVSGVKGKVASTLSYPLKLLEASDQFFRALAESGEKASLKYRAGKGVAVANLEQKAADTASYRLFRQELFPEGQGTVLDAVDTLTNTLMQWRNSKNPIVRNVAKWTVPFVQTPMNIFKQGLEYSPAGFATALGAADKQLQVTKAAMGSAVFAGAATLLASDRLTWGEPTDPQQRNDFRAAGRQAYSVRLGDHWVSYQKLPPVLAFPLAIVASLDDLLKNQKADEDTVQLILGGIAKYGEFLADQSYVKQVGDLLKITESGTGLARVIGNYPQQLVPFRALGGWLARLADATQRQVDGKADFVEKQMQLLMLNVPGLSQKVPARTDSQGTAVPQQNPVLNALSPVNVSDVNRKLEEFLDKKFELKKLDEKNRSEVDAVKARLQPTYDEVQRLVAEGKQAEANQVVNGLSEEDYEVYKSLRTADRRRQTQRLEPSVLDTVQKVRELEAEGKKEEAQGLVDALSDQEYRVYQSLKKRLGFE